MPLRKPGLESWAAIGAVALSISGCPDDCHTRHTDVPVVAAAEDPSLGAFSGPLTWLQTGEQTEMRLRVTRAAPSATKTCGQTALPVNYELETDDGLVMLTETTGASVNGDGFMIAGMPQFSISAQMLIEANKLPDAPGIADREPLATVVLETDEHGTWMAAVVVETSSDYLTVAAATLTLTMGP